jgi:hypothetical protein
MESLLESLKDYFESTPKEVLDNDWKAVEYLNNIGPDVMEYVEFMKETFGITVPYSIKEVQTHKYDVSVDSDKGIAVDSLYYYAA